MEGNHYVKTVVSQPSSIMSNKSSFSRIFQSSLLGVALLAAPQLSAQTLRTYQSADAVLGQPVFSLAQVGSGQTGMDFPLDVAIDPASGKVFVSDADNNRVLRFSSAAAMTNGSPAEAVLGQPDFNTVTAGTSATKMDIPDGLAIGPDGSLWVADAFNNRVLRFDNAATIASGSGADGVLGQSDFITFASGLSATRMDGPAGITVSANGTLWVADTFNNRVLRFDNAASKADGAAADGVLGQPNFVTELAAADRDGLSRPMDVAVSASGVLFVADRLNHRVLRFDNAAGKANGADAEGVLGQVDFTSTGFDRTQTTFASPYGVALNAAGDLFVADFGNLRVLGFFRAATLADGAPANVVLGQPDFTAVENVISAKSVGQPDGLDFDADGRLWVAQGNRYRVTRFTPISDPDVARPTVRITGKKTIRTTKRRVIIRGTATDELGVTSVEFKVAGSGGFKAAKGTSQWKAVVRPKKRVTKVKIRAFDAAGNVSAQTTAKIIRR